MSVLESLVPTLAATELLALFGHFMLLSLLAIGGVMATVPDMHRFVVQQRGWLDDTAFTASVALAQAAPGPNLIVVAVIGWKVGGIWGVLATTAGNLLPSMLLAVHARRWGERWRHAPALKAFRSGMAPLIVGLMLASGWVLTDPIRERPAAMLLALATAALMVGTKLTPLALIATGALLGAAGWV